MLVLFALPAMAATWSIDPSGSGDFLTIQAGISAATDGDILLVAAGTYAEGIDFLGKDLAVRGSGEDLTILDPGGSVSDAVRFVSGEGPGAVLSDLTIRNDTKRGILVAGASPVIERVTFDALGRPTDPSFHGGGASISGGAPLFRDCTFQDGVGWFGGDLQVIDASHTRIERSTMLRSHAEFGGSVYVAGATLDLDEVRIEGAFAAEDGGAIHVAADGSVATTWSTFTLDATNADPSATGGALYLADRASWTDIGSSLDGNYGYYGGAVYALTDASIHLVGTTFTHNTSTHRGGALHLTGTTVTLLATRFSENAAGSSGGAIHGADTTLTDTASTFTGNISACSVASLCNGGGIDVEGTILLEDTAFAGNTSGGYGGGAALEGDVLVHDATFDANVLVDGNGGGGLALLGGTATVGRCRFDANDVTTADDGGGMWTDLDVAVVVEDATFTGNIAGTGGGIAGRGELTVRRSTFSGHTTAEGGGIYHAGAGATTTLEVVQCSFDDNTSDSGGAIRVYATPNIFVRDSVFDDNGSDGSLSSQAGGAVSLAADGRVEITGNRFCRNRSYNGGGLYFYNSGDLAVGDDVVAGNVFQDNTSVNGGGTYLFSTGFLELQSNTFVANAASGSGGSVYCSAGVDGGIVDNVFAHSDGAAFHGATTSSYTYNAWFGNTADVAGGLTTLTAFGTGSVLDDPLFVAFTDDDLCNDTLIPAIGSPLIDTGDPAILDWDGSPGDIGYTGGPWTPLRDLDDDGFPAWTDCDDTDPVVFPGAVDIWYDGIDADCARDDDYDQDRDGFPVSVDCDDTDADAHPAGEEVWYDGVDGDCDGGSDYDQDGDGSDRDVDGGTDCDDLSSEIRPGAIEIWYDGVDQDCSGGSDYDADVDGDDAIAYGGGDCDDADPTRSSIEPEVWYDGIDQNCDGASDYDQDGDGDDALSQGGTDCDDQDPAVHVGATEVWYDGIDADCDNADDYDQDGDGYPGGAGGTDCDDLDPAVHDGCDPGDGDKPGDGAGSGCGCDSGPPGGAIASLVLLLSRRSRPHPR